MPGPNHMPAAKDDGFVQIATQLQKSRKQYAKYLIAYF